MGQFLNLNDLTPLAPNMTEAQADVYIEDVEARALLVAPCIAEAAFEHGSAVRSILRQAVLRWHRAGEGGVTTHQQNAGPFGQMHVYDSRSSGSGRLYPNEIRDLQQLCRLHSGIGKGRKAFTVAPK